MFRFRNKRMVPPGGFYFYQVPETNITLRAPTFNGLIQQLRTHYKANQVPPPPNLEALVEHHMCQRLPDGICVGEGERKARAVTLHDIRRSTEALLPGGLVDEEEARRRLAICQQCTLNDRQLCSSCTGLTSWAKRLVHRSIPRDEWLGVCTIDITALPARIHFRQRPDGVTYPSHCWAHTDE